MKSDFSSGSLLIHHARMIAGATDVHVNADFTRGSCNIDNVTNVISFFSCSARTFLVYELSCRICFYFLAIILAHKKRAENSE